MCEDFLVKFLSAKISNEFYREIVTDDRNISFTQLGHDECEKCEAFHLHEKSHSKNNLDIDCEICNMWQHHKL